MAVTVTIPTIWVPTSKKLAWYSYQLMTDKLDGADHVWALESPQGTHLYRFTTGGKSVWVAWEDGVAGSELTIEDIAATRVRVTKAVPNAESGRDIVDPTEAFDSSEREVDEGKVSLVVTSLPLFVEETD